MHRDLHSSIRLNRRQPAEIWPGRAARMAPPRHEERDGRLRDAGAISPGASRVYWLVAPAVVADADVVHDQAAGCPGTPGLPARPRIMLWPSIACPRRGVQAGDVGAGEPHVATITIASGSSDPPCAA